MEYCCCLLRLCSFCVVFLALAQVSRFLNVNSTTQSNQLVLYIDNVVMFFLVNAQATVQGRHASPGASR